MKFLEEAGECGLAAILNARRAQGCRELTMAQVRKRVGRTKEGTDEFDVRRGLYGDAIDLRTTDRETAIFDLLENLAEGNPVILAVDDETHWITAIGQIGDRIIIIDPDGSGPNSRENGVHVLTHRELADRWRSDNGYFGIVVM